MAAARTWGIIIGAILILILFFIASRRQNHSPEPDNTSTGEIQTDTPPASEPIEEPSTSSPGSEPEPEPPEEIEELIGVYIEYLDDIRRFNSFVEDEISGGVSKLPEIFLDLGREYYRGSMHLDHDVIELYKVMRQMNTELEALNFSDYSNLKVLHLNLNKGILDSRKNLDVLLREVYELLEMYRKTDFRVD